VHYNYVCSSFFQIPFGLEDNYGETMTVEKINIVTIIALETARHIS